MMTDTPMPERQEHAIELQWEIAALPPSAAFHQSFIPHGHVVDLLVKIAVSDSRFAADARTVLEEWRNGLATPEQIPNDELEVGGGAVVSEADEGYLFSTWAWVGMKGDSAGRSGAARSEGLDVREVDASQCRQQRREAPDRSQILRSVNRSLRQDFNNVVKGQASQQTAMYVMQDIALWFANEVIEGRATLDEH